MVKDRSAGCSGQLTQGSEIRRAVFLDRDGTINVEKDYLWRREDFEFIEGVPESIRRLKEAGFLVFVVTNQSGVARGYYGLEEVDALHQYMQEQLSTVDACVDGIYVCPHHPTSGVGEFLKACDCRKGRPGMLLQAALEHDLDLAASYMVGDKGSDIQAGNNAGCRTLLVQTGYGESAAEKLIEGTAGVFPSLVDAVDFILGERNG